jgi:hypothetical protein
VARSHTGTARARIGNDSSERFAGSKFVFYRRFRPSTPHDLVHPDALASGPATSGHVLLSVDDASGNGCRGGVGIRLPGLLHLGSPSDPDGLPGSAVRRGVGGRPQVSGFRSAASVSCWTAWRGASASVACRAGWADHWNPRLPQGWRRGGGVVLG